MAVYSTAAYKASDGKFYETIDEARLADFTFQLKVWADSNIASGSDTFTETVINYRQQLQAIFLALTAAPTPPPTKGSKNNGNNIANSGESHDPTVRT